MKIKNGKIIEKRASAIPTAVIASETRDLELANEAVDSDGVVSTVEIGVTTTIFQERPLVLSFQGE
jgi:hypothetical protein